MKTIVIADAGATKTAWAVRTASGTERFTTPGVNPSVMTAAELAEALAPAASRISGAGAVWFYGAGCLPDRCTAVADLLRHMAPGAAVSVASDMLGAARALLGDTPGIACILGTGSNSCLYDGQAIAANVPPLGWILGDEGSGAALGRRLLADRFKGLLPADVADEFDAEFRLTRAEAIERVYRTPGGNRFLASMAPFIAARLDRNAMRSLAVGVFEAFFIRNVERYPGFRDLPLAFCGSIARHFAQPLSEAAARRDLAIHQIVASPLNGLIDFHR